ncbi:hypothetical protein [Amycolatopsis lexingtonensis]|uniref:hypothetical protein n=1 Tax=Amycolatopsis lexingtonensis TaxID=218822 RepID=UPI003F6F831D
MSAHENGRLEAFEQAFAKYWPGMVQAGRNASAGKWDAEDAAAEAFASLLEKLGETTPADRPGWWYLVTRNKLRDMWRKPHVRREVRGEGVPEPVEPAVCAFWAADVRSDTLAFVDRVLDLMDEGPRRDVPWYLEVAMTDCTQADLAELLGIELPALAYRRRRAHEGLREAATVALMTAAPGEGSSRCEHLLELAEGATDSPEFRREVQAHLGDCERCRRRAADRNGLRSAIFVGVPGLALGAALLRRLLAAPRITTVSAAAGVGVTGAMLVTIFLPPATTGPVSERASPQPVIETTAEHGQPITTTSPSPTPPSSTSLEPSSVTVPMTGSTPPSRTTTVTPTPDKPASTGGSARQDSTPTVTGWWVQYRSIVASDGGKCGNEPRSSAVRITVEPGAETARLLVTFPGGSFPLPMQDTGGGTGWAGQVGPSGNEDADATLHITAEVTGTTGNRTQKDLGTIDVHPCRRGN